MPELRSLYSRPSRRRRMWAFLSELPGPALLVLGVWLSFGQGCHCGSEPPTVIKPEPILTVPTVDIPPVPPPTSSQRAPHEPPPPPVEDDWQVVTSLGAVEGQWGAPGEEPAHRPWVDLRGRDATRRAGGKWDLPYPWRVRVASDTLGTPFDCGFFENLQDDWRVGYCQGGNLPKDGKRYAHRIVLHVKPGEVEQLRVRIGSVAEVVVDHL
jgi:hypothetical protein